MSTTDTNRVDELPSEEEPVDQPVEPGNDQDLRRAQRPLPGSFIPSVR